MSEIKSQIYLDHHATTPLDKRVLDEMMPYNLVVNANNLTAEEVFSLVNSAINGG